MKTIYITEEQIEKIKIFESKKKKRKKKPSAQDQVHNRVNAGIMDAVTMCGMVGENADPESDKYNIGIEKGGLVGSYYHINEGKNDDNKEKEIRKCCHEIEKFMKESGLEVFPFPDLNLDWSEQDGIFIRTGFYSPNDKSVTVFCNERNIKDILRSFAHELIHHMQNLRGDNLSFTSDDDVKDNKELEKIEAEAYLKGNIYFRKWTEYETSKDKTLNEGKKKQTINDEGEIVPDNCECGGKIGTYICGEPIYKCTKCGKYYGTVKFTLHESIIDETEPEDIDLSSFNIKHELNPKFWKNNLLDSRIRLKLMDIADDFIDFLGIDWVEPDDVIITGSLANYNWNKKYSDIDLHVLIDFSKVDEKTDFVKKYFDSLKNQWNEEHKDLNVYGFPVEVYVQDTNEVHTSSGVYSLDKNEWITEPIRSKLTNSKVNKQLIKKNVAKYIDLIEDFISFYEKNKNDNHKLEILSDKVEKLLHNIKEKRKNSLKGEKNEISNGNIFFKSLRRLGYIDKLYELKRKIYDIVNSL